MSTQAVVFEARIQRCAQRYATLQGFSKSEHYILGFHAALPLPLRPKLMSLLELASADIIDSRMLCRAVAGLKRMAQDELDAGDNNPETPEAA